MSGQGVTRRDVLRTLAAGAVGGSVLQVIPAKAAEYAHQMVHKEKTAAPAGKYAPKFFDAHQYETLNSLCDTIIPKDEKSGGAIEAGAPEFIDLLTSENEEYQLKLGGGLLWLDTHCVDQYGKTYLRVHAGAAERSARSDRLPEKCKDGSVIEPGRGVFCVPAKYDVRRFLYQQDRDRRFAVHWQCCAE